MAKEARPMKGWESHIEAKLRQAREAGEFDSLPGMGRPAAEIDAPYEENWWLKQKLRDEQVSALPVGLQIKLDVERGLAEIAAMTCEQQVRRTVERLNEKIRVAHYNSGVGPASTTLPLEVEEVLANWRANRAE